MSRVVILVPRRADNGTRDRIWAWCRARWEALFPEYSIYEGHHVDGPFNRSAALNCASDLADVDGRWDVAIVIDADVFLAPGNVRAAVEIAGETGRVTWAFRRWRGLTEQASARLIEPDAGFEHQVFGEGGLLAWDDGEAERRRAIAAALRGTRGLEAQTDAVMRSLTTVRRTMVDTIVEKTNPLSWSCCFAVPRAGWDLLGGFDERFRGWGFEDMAWQSAAVGLVGHERVEGDLFHVWHPRSPGIGQASRDERDRYSADAINNARLGRRYMVALRRDHGLTDRSSPTDPDEMARDIENLRRDDEKLAVEALRLGLPDWSPWWPTLEELIEGGKTFRVEEAERQKIAGRSVTVVVHTGGIPSAWLERREYLLVSIPSLAENVTGPIVQRVIYDCWGDPAIRTWLGETFGPLGFYVVGPTNRPTYTESMQAMWRYLERRAVGSFVFQAEDDFTYRRPVDLDPMIDTLLENGHLRQLALLREAYYPREIAAGGIIAEQPEAYDLRNSRPHPFIEHRLYFTANPSLFPRSLASTPWPSGASSERLYTEVLNRDPASRFAYWGDGEPLIDHIGAVKAAMGGY